MKALLPALFLVAACATGTRDEPIDAGKYRALLADPVRSERDRGMDERRRPVELLQFAQVRPGMCTVRRHLRASEHCAKSPRL